MGTTIFDKIWQKHVVTTIDGGPSVIYIDSHLIHEVTSPQAFKGLSKRGIPVFRPKQVDALKINCANFGIELYGLGHPYQGIVHVIGPELGITQPGMTMVCGDSH